MAKMGGGVRFAPSPTGRFHVGNLRTAWVSHKLARHLQKPWVVRFEDIDHARVVPQARAWQLEDMSQLGLVPDLQLLQSEFFERHWEIFTQAVKENRVYPCDCSRKDVQQALAQMASAPHGVLPVYSGACRHSLRARAQDVDSIAWRFRAEDPTGADDFIIARSSPDLDSEGMPNKISWHPSYHWACAIDDWDGQYDLIVRSSDLRSALSCQRAIQSWLGQEKPFNVFHTSLVTQNEGMRLEKRTQGVTLNELTTRGITPQQLVEVFSQSFVLPDLKREDSEPALTLRLCDLGL